MPKEWGISGQRLRFQVVFDLTKEPLSEQDGFLNSNNENQGKIAKIAEAFVFPHGAFGRMPLKTKATGGYQVIPGGGPVGTDIVRLYLELEEELKIGDVSCPPGRIYGTCGYFGMEHFHHSASTKTLKEKCHDELKEAAKKNEDLRSKVDKDDRLLSWEKVANMKKLHDSNADVEKLTTLYREARQREPDLSQVRPSRKGDVALSREGGVCCKVNKGLSVEYHILGRMEVASVDVKPDRDEYQDLIHSLRP